MCHTFRPVHHWEESGQELRSELDADTMEEDCLPATVCLDFCLYVFCYVWYVCMLRCMCVCMCMSV